MSRIPKQIALSCSTVVASFGSAGHAQVGVDFLRAMYPGVRVHNAGQNFRYFYGADMTPGPTEEQAAAAFLALHGSAFGGPQAAAGTGPKLVPVWTMSSMDDEFVVFTYRQRIRGKDADGTAAKIKVKRGAVPRVDFAAARLAGEPTLGSEIPLVPAEVAVFLARAQSGMNSAAIEGSPEVVVLRGNQQRPDAWCWRVVTRLGDGPLAKLWTHYVCTNSATVLHSFSHSFGFQPATTGHVTGTGTAAAPPWTPYGASGTTLVTHLLPGVRVNGHVTSSAHTYTNSSGFFSLVLGSSGYAITLDSNLSENESWYSVLDPGFAFVTGGASAMVGDDVTFGLQNSAMTEEHRVAQVDVVVSANRARDFFLMYISTTAPTLSYGVGLFTNYYLGTCGATYPSTNSYNMAFDPTAANSPRRNCGCHSIVGHEYGHVALLMLSIDRSSQPVFHEGYADTYSLMLNDNSVVGPFMNLDDTDLRANPLVVNCQYPLPTQSQTCDCFESYQAGQLLVGPWVRIREALKTSYGAAQGLERARGFFGRWSLVTLGGDSRCDSAHPGTLMEVLSVAKGGDQFSIACSSFSAHGITVDACSP